MYFYSKMKVALMKPAALFLLRQPIPICHVGAGKVREVAQSLTKRGVHHVLVITSKTPLANGLPEPMLQGIKAAGIRVTLTDRITPDPTFACVADCLALCKQQGCDAVIAFGGGSVLDAAKVVAAAYTNGGSPEALCGLLRVRRPALPLIAVPTTAGTGSETTIAAVISDTVTHRKRLILDPKLVPCDAVFDPELTVGLSQSMTAQTAFDALTHAVESHISGYSTPRTRAWSETAIRLIYENLCRVWTHPADLAGRAALQKAAFYAGLAFTRTYVGYVHAFAHSLAAKYGVPHGLGCALILPHVMRQYESRCEKQFAHLAASLGIAKNAKSAREKSKAFVDSVFRLRRCVQLPERLDNFSQSDIPAICRMAFAECHGTYPVPGYFSPAQAKNLLEHVAAR